MAVLTVQKIANSGIVPSFAAAAGGGDSFANDGSVFLYVKNGGGAPINVTIAAPYTIAGLAVTAPVVAVANAAEKMIGPFDPTVFNQSNGQVNVTYSAVTTVTVGVFSKP